MIVPLPLWVILNKKTSPIHHLRTMNTVTVPSFNAYLMKNSIAFRASIVWNLLTPDLAKTSNVENYTRMASKSDILRNLDFRVESPQSIPHINMWLCLTRTGNYKIHEFDWLESILTVV